MCGNGDQIAPNRARGSRDPTHNQQKHTPAWPVEVSPSPHCRTTWNVGPCKPHGTPGSQATAGAASGINRDLRFAFFTTEGIISPQVPKDHTRERKEQKLPAEPPL